MSDDLEIRAAILKFCEGLFATSNLIGTDFDDVSVMEVKGRNLPQQPDGAGLYVTFSVSWHAIGKTGERAHDALGTLYDKGVLRRDD